MHALANSRLSSVFLLAAFPAVAFAFCPSLDLPFESAKLSVLLAFGAIALLLLAFVKQQEIPAEKTGIPVALSVWIAAMAVATAVHGDVESAWRSAAAYVAAGSVVYALQRLQTSARVLVRCMAITSVLFAVVVLIGVCGLDLPKLLSGTAAPGRMKAAATLGNPLFVASFLSASVWSVCALRDRSALVRGVLLAIVVLAIAVTGERTAAAAVAVGAVVWFFASRGSQGDLRRALVSFVAVVVLGLSAWLLNPRTAEDALAGRLFLWRTSLHRVSVVGDGAGSFYRSYGENLREIAPRISGAEMRYVSYETQAHNLFVQEAVESGLTGLTALLFVIGCWYRAAWRRRELVEVRVALAGVAAYLTAGCFDNSLSRPEGVLLPALLMTLPWLRVRTLRDKPGAMNHNVTLRWIFPVASAALMVAAVANTISSYAVFAGERAEQLAQMPEAERWLRRAVAIDHASRDARFDLVRVLCESGDYRGCWSESENAQRWVNEAELHLLRVRALEAMGRDSLARRELDAARRQFPWSDELFSERLNGPTTE